MHMGKHYKPMQTVTSSAGSTTTVDGIGLEAIRRVFEEKLFGVCVMYIDFNNCTLHCL